MMPKTTPSLLRRKQPQPTITSLHLPFDLVEEEILCRLPVKHLLRLRCVCKPCNSLISSDSNFANKHLRLSSANYDRHHLILSSPEFVLFHSPISSFFRSANITMSIYSLRESLNKKILYANRASTCDGIICFKIDNSSALLCNPSIRKFKILPLISFSDQGYFQTLYTLYTLVCFTNKYKIIAVYTSSLKKEVHVHTLGTDYWRRIQDYPGPNFILRARSGTFVNDSVNWLTRESDSCAQYIVSLDLEKELYQKLSLPVFDVHFTTSCVTTLGTLRGCLSLFCYRDMFCDVWIMKEYGNQKSWTKLLTVPPMRDCHYYSCSEVFYISKDDQVLMEVMKSGYFTLVVYDSINNIFKIPNFQNYAMTPDVYVESLISPL
ncbi:F-box/kelch-repeat protein At3g23880-like [Vicia villosa]|uniref:F-box/kelch-repeat protein At3g23880-like n=1 Tax=Vicia villosa TaxID=3911 RepID=UPI00273B7143|nr:F-box/kelch-repeat protein At3g23880-like [Vicia villosa]